MGSQHGLAWWKGFAGLLAVFLLVAAPAESAFIVLDNGGVAQNPAATMFYNGVGGSLIGSQIDFNSIQGNNTPFNAGVPLTCVGCQLNFQTGGNLSEGPTQWDFAGGGNFVVRGTIPFLGIVVPNSVILTGTFTGPNLVSGVGTNLNFSGFGIDIKAPELVNFFYGIVVNPADPPIFLFSNTTITGDGITNPNGGFLVNVRTGDISNQLPEPGSALLLLLGLGSLAAYRRRRS